jgi:non-heme chloroperoxidase
MAMSRSHDYIMTNDGVNVHYVESGQGPTVLVIPGWSQSAAEFEKQIDDLSRDHRIIVMDSRGHGKSGKPGHGYRVSRLAADLRELILSLGIEDVTLVGHSLGCSVIWSYWDLFGGAGISKLVLADQSAVLTADPGWPDDQAAELGAIFTPATALELVAGIRGPEGEAASKVLLGSMHTSQMSSWDADWIAEQNFLLPREYAATLMQDHLTNDWRDVLPRIDAPTLVIGGEVSIIPQSAVEWIASKIPKAELRVFSESESGSHLMFWEGAALFNSLIRNFVGGHAR